MIAPVLAGTSAQQVAAPRADSCIASWFAGASGGYLTKLEEPMYNIHVGVTNTCWDVAGCKVSLFGEVGYADKDWSNNHPLIIQNNPTTAYLNYDLAIVPVTFNFKLEHPITGNLNSYFGAGLGMAWMNFDIHQQINNQPSSAADGDMVFAAQVFAGLNYHVTQDCELYGGGRWIHYANPSFSTSMGYVTLDLTDDCLLEFGVRYKL